MSVNHVLSALLQVIATKPDITVAATLDNGVGANVTLSNGDLTYTSTSASTACSARSTTSRSSSKVYFEVTVVEVGDCFIGFGTSAFSDASSPGVPGWYSNSYGWRQSGELFYNTSGDGVPSVGWQTGDVLAFAIDLTGQKLYLNDLTGSDGWNGGSGNPSTGTGGYSISGVSGALNAIIANYNENTGKFTFNFGGSSFTGSIPSGFVSWNAGS